MKKLIISGSSRKDGDTAVIVNAATGLPGWDFIDLNDYQFSYYDYVHLNKNDDFIPLMKRVVDQYDVFVFVTPVYWYAMSGIMKVFFDRLTDLLEIEKETGRKLRGKSMAAISCSMGDHLGDLFWLPFSSTAAYLGMHYLGNLHCISGQIDDNELQEFLLNLES